MQKRLDFRLPAETKCKTSPVLTLWFHLLSEPQASDTPAFLRKHTKRLKMQFTIYLWWQRRLSALQLKKKDANRQDTSTKRKNTCAANTHNPVDKHVTNTPTHCKYTQSKYTQNIKKNTQSPPDNEIRNIAATKTFPYDPSLRPICFFTLNNATAL